jgi:hypothetical protein
MRTLFLLLVLANIVFFAYAHVAREDAGAASEMRQLQIEPEKIRPLTAPEPPPAFKPGTTRKGRASALPKAAFAAPAACLEWGFFAGPAVARAEAALAALRLPAGQVGRSVTDAGGYWVYIPSFKTRAEADRRIGELRALGVTEFFLVQEPAQWRYAISLGIFRSEEAAQVFLARLRERGVRTAIAARRENFLKQVAFHVREPSQATVAQVTALQQEFPGSEVKAGPCPTSAVVVKN